MREDKKLVPDPLTKDIPVKIFNLYLEGNSHQGITNILNKEKVLGRTNWLDSTVQKILTTEIIIRAILIDDKKLLKEDKLRFGLITLDLDNVKEFYDEEYLNYIFVLSEEYIKSIKQIFNGKFA